MKFESKFGLGEIVIYDPCDKASDDRSAKHQPLDAILEVVGIVIDRDSHINYVCRYPCYGTTVVFTESQLSGDVYFNQELGRYPE